MLRSVARSGAPGARWGSWALSRLAALTLSIPTPVVAQEETESARVVFGRDTVHAEVARTAERRERGLMFREEVPPGTGMLFVFEEPEIQGVWMKDTLVPLDAAFMDEQAVVIDIEPLEPGDLTVKWASAPVLYVLEVPRGWFAARGIAEGDPALILFDDP